MITLAKPVKNCIPVLHSCSNGDNRLTVDCPNGWDDVKKLTNLILEHEGILYAWRGWDSDRNVCFFVEDSRAIATVKR